MKIVYSNDLAPFIKELQQKTEALLKEYQEKIGLSKNEIRLTLIMDKETDKIEVHLAINPETVNFVVRGHQKGSDT